MARVTWRAALTLCVVAACAYYYGLVSADCVSPARLAEIERSLLVALRKSVDPLKRERDSLRAENAALRSTRHPCTPSPENRGRNELGRM